MSIVLSVVAGIPICLAVIQNLLYALAPEPALPSRDTYVLLAAATALVSLAGFVRSPKPALSAFGLASAGMVLGCAIVFPIMFGFLVLAMMFM